MTVFEFPGKQYFIGFKTKKEAKMAKEYLRRLKQEHPEGKELGTFPREEALKRFARDKIHVWVDND